MHFPLECAQLGDSKQEQPVASRQLARGWQGWHGLGLTCQQLLRVGFREKRNPDQKHSDLESQLHALRSGLGMQRLHGAVQRDPVTRHTAGRGMPRWGGAGRHVRVTG